MTHRSAILCACALAVLAVAPAASARAQTTNVDYQVLATNKTSTMEREMNDAASAGYRYSAVMGGETSFGGSEVVTITRRKPIN